MTKKKYSGERLETFIFSRDATEHLHRYAMVKTYVKGKTVLDIASGEGYGSNLLKEEASCVFGIDVDNVTIEKAKLKYKKDNLFFIQGSTSAIPLDDNSVDVVVSFETIEHHDEHEEMMEEIKRVLKPEGLTIISTPDKYYYSDFTGFNNEFHVKELYKEDFVNLIYKKFKNTQLLNQKYANGISLIQDEKTNKKTKFYNGSYLKVEEVKSDPVYLIIIASDSLFEKQNITIFNGLEFKKINQELIISNIKKSTTFRIGYIVLSPFQLIKKLFYI